MVLCDGVNSIDCGFILFYNIFLFQQFRKDQMGLKLRKLEKTRIKFQLDIFFGSWEEKLRYFKTDGKLLLSESIAWIEKRYA